MQALIEKFFNPGLSAKLVFIVVTPIILYWPGIHRHWELTQNPFFVPYDAAQYIPAFFQFDSHDPIPSTYAKEYYLNAVCPLLYKVLFRIGAQLGDVRQFHFLMVYLAYAGFLVVMGRLGWILGGAALSFAVVALTISAWIFIGLGFIGGAPRMYAYPLISLILYALILDRPKLLAGIVVLGGLLYPIVALIGGACLTCWMLLKPFSSRGLVSGWGFSRRLAVVALTGTLSVTTLLPLILGAGTYGRRIVETDISIYPEAGPDGNYRPYDQLPYKIFGYELLSYFAGPFYSHGDPVVPWLNAHKHLDPMTLLFVLALAGLLILVITVLGLKWLIGEYDGGGARLISFFVICAALHVVAWLASPYLYIPTRYFMFSLPFLITLIFPWALQRLLLQHRFLKLSCRRVTLAFIALICVYLAAFGGRGNAELSDAFVESRSQPLFEAIAALPKNSVIAGWPVGPVRKLEYVTRRNAFLTGDLHQVLHLKFTQAMRERMDALFDAYLSTDGAALYRLREQFGVTHMIVDIRDFSDPKHAPEYFAPWRARIQPRLAESKG
ncbi:MAG TPA: hypothetical protein VFY83_02615, partial [Anaerolineales bacterium]|nr:hypothetical protein [Anaerolineales bacterium]